VITTLDYGAANPSADQSDQPTEFQRAFQRRAVGAATARQIWARRISLANSSIVRANLMRGRKTRGLEEQLPSTKGLL